MAQIERQARDMGERDGGKIRSASPLLRGKDATSVPQLPAPKTTKPKHSEANHDQDTQEQTETALTQPFISEPPPIMKFFSSSENAFQPTEVLPYEPIDKASRPLMTKPAHRNSKVKLGYKTSQDAQAVTKDKDLALWIERQITRQEKKK